jgi:ABC-2 type transport system permease protein
MDAYLGFARRGFQRAITYPFQVWSELGINLLFMYVYVCLWRVLYTGRETVLGYDRGQMLTYIIVAQTLITFQFTVRTVALIEAKIRSGEIVIDLMRPIYFQGMVLATGLGTALHTVATNMAPKFALFAVTGVVGPPVSTPALGLFLISAALGYVILFAVEFLIGVAAFWLVEVRGLYSGVMWGINTFLSGYFVPLEFYPDWLAAIARAMPFQAMIYVPTAIYAGSLTGATATAAILGQAAWVVALLGAGRFLFRIAYRRLVVQGG